MLYHLFTTLREMYDLPGAGLFNFVSFRAGMSLMTSLMVGILFGKRIIERLQLKQVGEIVRDLGLEGQMNKQGTPTMGGLIILGAILLPTLLFADLAEKNLIDKDNIKIEVKKAKGKKCEICWKILEKKCSRKKCPL